jgi:hypothetical protein
MQLEQCKSVLHVPVASGCGLQNVVNSALLILLVLWLLFGLDPVVAQKLAIGFLVTRVFGLCKSGIFQLRLWDRGCEALGKNWASKCPSCGW